MRLNGAAGPLRGPARRDRRRRRRRPPGAQSHPALLRRREHPARTARRRPVACRIDYAAVHAEARRWLEVLELDLDPRTPVSQLNVAKMQLVEIAKALSLRIARAAARRADRLADAAGDAGAVPPAAQAARRGREPSVRQPQARGSAGNLRRGDGAARRPQRLPEPLDGGPRAPGPRAADDRAQRADPRLGAARSLRTRRTMLELQRRLDRARPRRHRPDRAQGRDRRPLRPRRRRPDGTRQMHPRPASRSPRARSRSRAGPSASPASPTRSIAAASATSARTASRRA